jgi:hypothetical protein
MTKRLGQSRGCIFPGKLEAQDLSSGFSVSVLQRFVGPWDDALVL